MTGASTPGEVFETSDTKCVGAKTTDIHGSYHFADGDVQVNFKYAGTIRPDERRTNTDDPTHLNDIGLVQDSLAEEYPMFEPGDLDFVLDVGTGRVNWYPAASSRRGWTRW